MAEDFDLLHQYAGKRSEAAFTALVQKYLGLVYSVALRQVGGNAHLAEDVAQKVFTDLARKASTLSHHPVLSGWLYRSTQFTAIDALRAEQRRRAREQEAQIMHELSSPSAAVEQEKLCLVLDQAMAQLNAADRDAVMLRFFEGQPFAEIGQRLRLTEEAARKRVERALDKLRILLAKRGLSSTAAAVGAALSQEAAAAAPAGLATAISGNVLMTASIAVPGLGLIALMTAKKTAVLLSILGVGAIGLGVWQWQKNQRVQSELAAAAHHLEARQQELRALRGNLQARQQSLAELQREIGARAPAETVTRPATPPPAARPPRDFVKENADWRRFAAVHPEAHGIMVEKYKDQVRMYNRPFFLLAGLTTEQSEQFVTRMAERIMQNVGIAAPGGPPREGAGGLLGGAVQQSGNKDRDELLREILGEPEFQRRTQEYERMIPVGTVLTAIRNATVLAEAPLDPADEVRLAHIIANSNPDYAAGRPLPRVAAQFMAAVDWANVAVEAKNLLSPAMWRGLEGYIASLQYQQALEQAQRNQAANARAARK